MTPQDLLTIRTLGDLLDDLEKTRIQNGNRIFAATMSLGGSLPALDLSQEGLKRVEHQAERDLVRAWRRHDLAPWAKSVHGLGEKSIARLIAAIGDPYMATPGRWVIDDATGEKMVVADEQRPRTVSQLWAYCGYGDPSRKRVSGMTQDEAFALGKPRAKKQLYLIATSFLKAQGPYSEVYYEAKERYAERIHVAPCPQCHAKTGDPWKPGHQHAAALRYTIKQFLKELWEEGRALHPDLVEA